MTGDPFTLAIEFLASTVVLTLLLWIIIKIQSIEGAFLAVLGTTALACAIDTAVGTVAMIHLAGPFLAVPVLTLCLWKVTKISLFPDAVFTVIIAYVVMFLLKIILLAALISSLTTAMSFAREHLHSAENTNAVAATPDELAAAAQANTNLSAGKIKTGGTNQTSHKTNPANIESVESFAKKFSLKGISLNGRKSAVMINSGVSTYTLFIGQPTTVETSDGTCTLNLSDVGPNLATVEIAGQKVTLKLP
jgi:hypothetical protein